MSNKILFILVLALFSCGEEDHKDMQKPEIQIVQPQNCTVVRCGDSFTFTAQFADNAELGSYNLEIHHNFDHHSHSTDSEECQPDATKTPVKAWVFNQEYAIPAGNRNFDANVEIAVPADIDEGDYHFMVRLTDKSGWQQIASKSIKVRK
ncbi:MAG: DUF4625 domain-containing protein [Candidatus Symbiothrix sp.]|jgi:hypothetical protein|nr:DUF4625 domain-containing protein [Candidatus Symbiothrix sp.]